MTFNILFGAGVDRKFDDAVPPNKRQNRLDGLMELIKQADPDILGLQEAVSWGDGDPPVASQVAADLGMDYFVAADDPNLLPLAVFSKYKIIESEILTSRIGPEGVLRARMLTPDGEPLNVFVVHLVPKLEAAYRYCEVESLLPELQNYINERTIVMGDFNANLDSPEGKLLSNTGWDVAAFAAIDHIRVSTGVRWSATPYVDLPSELIGQVSDHPPVTTRIDFYPSDEVPTLLPWPTPTLIPVLPLVTDSLKEAKVLQVDPFEKHKSCYRHLWNADWNSIEMTQGQLIVFGKKDWQGGFRIKQDFNDNRAVLLRIKYSDDLEARIFFDHGEWQAPDYRRFGLALSPGKLEINRVSGSKWLEPIRPRQDFTPQPEVWYNLLLAETQDGNFHVLLWDPTQPDQVVEDQEMLGGDWSNLPWSFKIEANAGYLSVDEMQVISFSELR